ncbi:MAG: efflux RND transporter permease subunit [Chitinophagaceae bacterium]
MKDLHITYKKPLTLVLVLIILGGMFTYSLLQTSLFPEITFPKIKVIADAGLQPVDKMMITVTKPLENAIKQVPDLQTVRSTTSRGSCEISAYMNWNADIDLSQQRIESKINEIKNNLPPETQITVEKMNPSILPVMGYTLESNDKSPIDLKMLATYTIKPFLSQVSGVSEIRIIGGKTKEYWLQLNEQKMTALGITPEIVSNALQQTNFIKSNGYLADYRFLYLTVTDATVRTKDELENIVISNNKRIVTLKDIADVEVKEAVEYIKINANGKEGILIAVIKQPNANLIDISNAMVAKINELKKTLPKDVTIKPYYIQADFVNDSVKSVKDSLWIGLLLAIIVAILFLRSIKASATILITIPITIFLTIIVMYAVGYTFNIMTLGAIAAAIGLIIDDAIVVVEQIHRTHEENPDEPTTSLIHKAINFLFPAMVGSSLSTIVIFIPFVLMSGVAGAYFKVMTNTMIITLVCSFFVTWLGLPVIYLLLSKSKIKNQKSKTTNQQLDIQHPTSNIQQQTTNEQHEPPKTVKRQRWVSYFIFRPYVAIIIIAVFLASIIFILPQLQTGFLPEMDEGSLVFDYSSPPGTSLEETDRMLREVEKIIIAEPDVEAYSRRTGTQMGFFITEPNTGDYLIQLKKNRSRTTDEVINDIRQKVESTQPALRVDFGQVIGDMLGDLMSSTQPIEIKIFGTDIQKLKQLSNQVADIADSVKGTADVFNGIVIAGPSISIQPDFAKLAQFGITPVNLQYQLQTSLEGNVVGNIMEKEQLTDVRIVYPNSRKLSIDDISQMQIFLPTGQLRPITDLANVTVQPGDAEIKRENLQSMGVVSARLENRDLGSVIKDLQTNISNKVALPQGYHIEYGGDYAQQQQSFKELLIILITASLLVFCVILFLFKEFKVALIILMISVLGIAGSYLALFITGTPLNVGSYTGLIMIVGIIGENSIFTLWQFKEARLTQSVDESIVYSISTRLRPKLMTALGAIIALMPLALGIGTGAQLHQPLAIAVIGGFIAALPLLLIVLPSMLRIAYRKK